MRLVGHIEPFVPGGNFRAYEDRLTQFFLVNDVQEEAMVPLFITIAGPDIYEILTSLMVPDIPSSKSFDVIMKTLREHFTPKKNKRSERYRFYKAVQEEGESINEFVIRLKMLSQSCQFGDYLGEDTKDVAKNRSAAIDEALADRFIVGLRDEKIQQSLLNDDTLKLEDYITKALNLEMAQKESKSMNSFQAHAVYNSGSSHLSRSKKKSSSHSSKSQSPHNANRSNSPRQQSAVRKSYNSLDRCRRCGREHDARQCPAINWSCFVCHKKGHTSRVCFKKSGYVNVINSITNQHKPAVCTLNVEGQQIQMEVDTGACVTIISKGEYFKKFRNVRLNKLDCKELVTVTGQNINELGEIEVEVDTGCELFKLKMIVMDSDRHFNALLGRNWIDVLYPQWKNAFVDMVNIKAVSDLNTNDVNLLNEIKVKFPKVVVKGLVTPIEGFMVDIVLKENQIPIFHAPYGVPFKLRDKFCKEISNLTDQSILVPIKSSRWASPVVIVPKSNGDIRLCIDCKVTINKCIQTEHYPLPRIEDIFASLATCRVFCVIDLTGAYLQLSVSPESQELLTINTFKGLFKYTRLPFGVSNSASIFQSIMDQILVKLDNVFCYLDDILIGGPNIQECKEKLFLVLSRLNEYNVRINLDKCKFLEKTVKYLGHTLYNGEVRPNDDKVEAILKAPAPSNVQQLQSYLGLINYYGKFIPNLSSELKDLYKLLQKNINFVWSSDCQRAFTKTKELITSHNVLELYDPQKPIVIATDASPYGVGAVLSHIVDGIEKPVLFASSTLSNAEKNYSQIHREALAIVFAVRRFHNYIYGHSFTLCTDHQSLKEIFNPKKSTPSVAAARLQRWAVILSMYDYQIVHRRGSLMSHADALSRLPIEGKTEIEEVQINFFNFSNDAPVDWAMIQKNTMSDPVLSKVFNYVHDGWPKVITEPIKPYFAKRLSLSTESKSVYYINRIVVPSSLRSTVLKSLHENHTGIVRMKMIARSYVWWPNCDKDIEQYVYTCSVCQQSLDVKKEIVNTSWPQALFPLDRIHLDFFYFAGKQFLVLVDAYSKFCDIQIMVSTNLSKVIEKLTAFFSLFGLPNEIVTDNGPPFQSHGFKMFCRNHGIKCTKSPPYHPQSNGQAERFVRTVKTVFKKFCLENRTENLNQRVNKFLIYHRNTPSSTTSLTPAQLLFSYKPKILLDLVNNKKKVQFDISKNKIHVENSSKCKVNKNNISKNNEQYLRKGKLKNERTYFKYKVNEDVLYLNHFRSFVRWIPAKVVKVISPLTYLVNINNNIRFVHQNQLKSSKLMDSNKTEYLNKSYNERQTANENSNEEVEEEFKIKNSPREINSPYIFNKRKLSSSSTSSSQESSP